jgi:hypothetical protein
MPVLGSRCVLFLRPHNYAGISGYKRYKNSVNFRLLCDTMAEI